MMTVQEFTDSKSHNKFWLCPDAVSNGRISRPLYLGGIECTGTTIPENLKPKCVVTSFPDNDFICVIWKNDEDEYLGINGWSEGGAHEISNGQTY